MEIVTKYDTMEFSSPSLFKDIIISASMYTDHMPDLYEMSLQNVLDKLLLQADEGEGEGKTTEAAKEESKEEEEPAIYPTPMGEATKPSERTTYPTPMGEQTTYPTPMGDATKPSEERQQLLQQLLQLPNNKEDKGEIDEIPTATPQ